MSTNLAKTYAIGYLQSLKVSGFTCFEVGKTRLISVIRLPGASTGPTLSNFKYAHVKNSCYVSLQESLHLDETGILYVDESL